MRLTLIISSVLLISSTEAITKDELHEVQKDCKKETGVKEYQLESLKTARKIEESNRSAGDYVLCLAIKLNFMEGNGSLKKDETKKYFIEGGMSEEDSEKTIEECDSIEKSEDITLTVIHYTNCFNELIPENVRITGE